MEQLYPGGRCCIGREHEEQPMWMSPEGKGLRSGRAADFRLGHGIAGKPGKARGSSWSIMVDCSLASRSVRQIFDIDELLSIMEAIGVHPECQKTGLDHYNRSVMSFSGSRQSGTGDTDNESNGSTKERNRGSSGEGDHKVWVDAESNGRRMEGMRGSTESW